MKATKKQIAEVTEAAKKANFSVEKALATLSFTSASVYKAIGAEGVVDCSIRKNSTHFVDTFTLQKNIGKNGDINNYMTIDQQVANGTF